MKHIAAAYRRVGSIRKAGRPISLDGAQHGESQVRVRYISLIGDCKVLLILSSR